MEVVAFIGPSGTGKSHRALVVAHSNEIECIIDDGILIFRNRIVAGKSAKKETSRLKAVRRAIFQDQEQVEDVKRALKEIQPEKLLILGTSENMVCKIGKAIGVGAPSRFIRIEDIATTEEIEKAQEARLKEGKHIIPVPTMEVKNHFRGYLIDPLRSYFRRKRGKKSEPLEGTFEKSVIRPVFSYYGKLTFSDGVLDKIVRHALRSVLGIVKVNELNIKKSQKGTNGLMVDLQVTIAYGENIKKLMSKVKNAIQEEIEYTTGMSIERLQIVVKGVAQRR